MNFEAEENRPFPTYPWYSETWSHARRSERYQSLLQEDPSYRTSPEARDLYESLWSDQYNAEITLPGRRILIDRLRKEASSASFEFGLRARDHFKRDLVNTIPLLIDPSARRESYVTTFVHRRILSPKVLVVFAAPVTMRPGPVDVDRASEAYKEVFKFSSGYWENNETEDESGTHGAYRKFRCFNPPRIEDLTAIHDAMPEYKGSKKFSQDLFFQTGYDRLPRICKIADSVIAFLIIHDISTSNFGTLYPLDGTKSGGISKFRVRVGPAVEDSEGRTLSYDGYVLGGEYMGQIDQLSVRKIRKPGEKDNKGDLLEWKDIRFAYFDGATKVREKGKEYGKKTKKPDTTQDKRRSGKDEGTPKKARTESTTSTQGGTAPKGEEITRRRSLIPSWIGGISPSCRVSASSTIDLSSAIPTLNRSYGSEPSGSVTDEDYPKHLRRNEPSLFAGVPNWSTHRNDPGRGLEDSNPPGYVEELAYGTRVPAPPTRGRIPQNPFTSGYVDDTVNTPHRTRHSDEVSTTGSSMRQGLRDVQLSPSPVATGMTMVPTEFLTAVYQCVAGQRRLIDDSFASLNRIRLQLQPNDPTRYQLKSLLGTGKQQNELNQGQLNRYPRTQRLLLDPNSSVTTPQNIPQLVNGPGYKEEESDLVLSNIPVARETQP